MFSCRRNESKRIDVFDIAVCIIIVIINTIIVGIYIQGTFLVEVVLVIITCRSTKTLFLSGVYLISILIPKSRVKAWHQNDCAAVRSLLSSFSFLQIPIAPKFSVQAPRGRV